MSCGGMNDLPMIVGYYEGFRAPIFVACVTFGTFLFTMKSFIVVTMKREVYDTNAYRERFTNAGRYDSAGGGRYRGLKGLSLLLLVAILVALASAAIQVSIGWIQKPWAAWTALAFAGATLALVIWSVLLVYVNIRSMLEYED